jgi:hypothetical protein
MSWPIKFRTGLIALGAKKLKEKKGVLRKLAFYVAFIDFKIKCNKSTYYIFCVFRL